MAITAERREQAVTDPVRLFASARRILEGAARDLANGLHLSACVGAQRAGVMATEAWLRLAGQPRASASVRPTSAGTTCSESAAALGGTDTMRNLMRLVACSEKLKRDE